VTNSETGINPPVKRGAERPIIPPQKAPVHKDRRTSTNSETGI